MNQLINNQEITMSSRVISDLVQSRHSDVCRSIDRLIQSGVIGGYAPTPYTHEQNGQTYYEYFLCKRDTYIVVAQLSPQFTAALVDRWQELESQQKPKLPQTYAEALLEAGRLALENEKQAEQLRLAAPKVEFVDRFTQREALQNATQVAQTMGMSAVKMNRALDEFGGVYNKSVKRSRAFCQEWIDSGCGKMIENDIGHPQAMFTTSGVARVTEIFISEGII